MATTKVSHVALTVSTVEVFIDTMKFIHENELWDEVQAYLKEHHKTEMFIDYDVFYHFRKMLEQDGRFDPDSRTIRAVRGHLNLLHEYPEETE